MKTLRELKYDLLFEQQLYRKYLDDYEEVEDGEKIYKSNRRLWCKDISR